MLLSMNDTVSKQSEVNRSSIIDAHNDDSVVCCFKIFVYYIILAVLMFL